MTLSRQATVSGTPERAASSLSERFASVTSLSVPEDSSNRPAGQQLPDIDDLQASTSLKASEPPAVFFRSTSPATVQSTAPVMTQTTGETSPSAPVHSPTSPALETSLATPQVPEATNDATWPPPFPRLSASPLRWSDLTEDSDEEDSEERSLTWQPSPATAALIPSFSGTGGTLAASGHALTSSMSPSLSLEESPTPLIAQSFNQSQSSPSGSRLQIPQILAEPVHTTIGFNLPLVPVPEDSPASGGTPCIVGFAETPGPSDTAWDRFVPSASPRSSPLPSEMGPRRHGYAGALTMLYSAADASNDRSARGMGSSSVIQPRVEAVLPIDNDEQVKAMVRAAAHGFLAAQEPQAPREGMGGTYFLLDDRGAPACIFKPCDEEPLAPNNPKGWGGAGRALGAPGMKPSVRVGEAALREVAAYLLDYRGFAGIPPACLVLCRHSKLNYTVTVPRIESMADLGMLPGPTGPLNRSEDLENPTNEFMGNGDGSSNAVRIHLSVPALPGGYKLGSLQAFAAHKCDANDFSPSVFSADNVHRIGIIDIRLLNTDRHAGNLLVAESSPLPNVGSNGSVDVNSGVGAQGTGTALRAPYVLVPIDHGFALPEALEEPYFEWMYWAQTSVPFSEEVRAYVAALNAKQDIAMLRERLPALRTECLRCLEVTTLVLKACVAAGLTLFELASLFSRPSEHVPSDFEALCMDARDNAMQAPSYLAYKPLSSASNSHHLSTANPMSPLGDHLTYPRASCSSVDEHTHASHACAHAHTTHGATDFSPHDIDTSSSGLSLDSSSDMPYPEHALHGPMPPREDSGSSPEGFSAPVATSATSEGDFMGTAIPPKASTAHHTTACTACDSAKQSPGTENPELPGFSTEMLHLHSPTAPQKLPESSRLRSPQSPCMCADSSPTDIGQQSSSGAAIKIGSASAPRPIESPWLRTAPVNPATGGASVSPPTSPRLPPQFEAASYKCAGDLATVATAPLNGAASTFGGRIFESLNSATMNTHHNSECHHEEHESCNTQCMPSMDGPLSSSTLPSMKGARASTGAHSGALISGPGGSAFPALGRSVRNRRRSAWCRKRGVGAGSYHPPLLLAAHPNKVNYVFSGVTEAQWDIFVESVGDFVAEELMKGTWRVRRSTGPVATSCPDARKHF